MSHNEFDVPTDFPQRSIGSGLAGAQLTLAVQEFEGRLYTLGNTPAERHARYMWCLNIAEQFVEKSRATKAGKRKDMPEADILQHYRDQALAANCGLELAEARWILRYVAAALGWPFPDSLAPGVEDLRTLAKAILGAVKYESWWVKPSMWLDYQVPAEMAQTNMGRKLIFEYLKRVETGTHT